MGRKIITINQELCNGCGDCISSCAEGALQIVNGKAQLVGEKFCDGFGDCLGKCPTGALEIIEREAVEFDLAATTEHVSQTRGMAGLERLEQTHRQHLQHHSHGGGCPGSLSQDFSKSKIATTVNAIPSELGQWPVQLHLVHPRANFFVGKEMVVLSTCAPISYPDVHWRFIRGRSVVVACPKLDNTGPYTKKLADIFQESTIPRIHVLVMEVPCCQGLWEMVVAARTLAQRPDLPLEKHLIGLQGGIINSESK